jgi:hypothetical protein
VPVGGAAGARGRPGPGFSTAPPAVATSRPCPRPPTHHCLPAPPPTPPPNQALEQVIPDIRQRAELTMVGTPLTHARFLNRHRGTYGGRACGGLGGCRAGRGGVGRRCVAGSGRFKSPQETHTPTRPAHSSPCPPHARPCNLGARRHVARLGHAAARAQRVRRQLHARHRRARCRGERHDRGQRAGAGVEPPARAQRARAVRPAPHRVPPFLTHAPLPLCDRRRRRLPPPSPRFCTLLRHLARARPHPARTQTLAPCCFCERRAAQELDLPRAPASHPPSAGRCPRPHSAALRPPPSVPGIRRRRPLRRRHPGCAAAAAPHHSAVRGVKAPAALVSGGVGGTGTGAGGGAAGRGGPRAAGQAAARAAQCRHFRCSHGDRGRERLRLPPPFARTRASFGASARGPEIGAPRSRAHGPGLHRRSALRHRSSRSARERGAPRRPRSVANEAAPPPAPRRHGDAARARRR